MDTGDILRLVAGVVAPAVFGISTFFIKSYFDGLKDAIRGLGEKVSRLDDHVQQHSVEIAQASTDLRAVWRMLDDREPYQGNGHFTRP